MFPKLFSPIKINQTEIKNRLVFPSLGLLYSLDRKLNDRFINFYKERAKGGVGIVTVGPIGIDYLGSGVMAPSIDNDEAIPSFSNLAKTIQAEGSKAWIQLFHAGAYSYSFAIGGKKALAPSAVYSKYTKDTPAEMTIEDIKTVQEAFIRGAERAKEAGFDGVEIIGSAGYLITQFLSPLKNKRTDEYGGSFENRIRFAQEIIEKMRPRLGNDFPVTIRMAGNDFVPESNTSSEMPQIAKVYEKAGIDAINVTGGWHESRVPQLAMGLPRGGFAYLAKNIKEAVSVPVMASNRIIDPYLAEQILKDDLADMINLGRVLLTDPYWPKKAQENRPEEIRPCLSCSQGCTDELFSGKPVFCLANPLTGFEGERKIAKAKNPKKVMIVGAGPGGLEAALRAHEAGHQVEIYEKKDEIGGQLWIAGAPPDKQEIWSLIDFYTEMLIKYKIDLYLEQEVNLDFIKKKKPDYLILAEGAEPINPPIKGFEEEKVISAWDLLATDQPIGKEVAVIGGGAVGLETAHFISLKGTISPDNLYFLLKYKAENLEKLSELITKGTKKVTVFEQMPKVGKGVGRSTKWILLGDLEKHQVKIIPEAKVLSVDKGLVTFEKQGKKQQLQFDNVINAVGSKSVRNLADQVESLGIPFAVIGDSVRPAQINDAIHEAFLAVSQIKD